MMMRNKARRKQRAEGRDKGPGTAVPGAAIALI